MDVHLITGDGVRDCAVDELPALLAAKRGIVWVDVPEWDAQTAEVLTTRVRAAPAGAARHGGPQPAAQAARLPRLAVPGPARARAGRGRARPPRRARPRHRPAVPDHRARPGQPRGQPRGHAARHRRGARAHPVRPAAPAHVVRHLARDRLDAHPAHGALRRGAHGRRLGPRAAGDARRATTTPRSSSTRCSARGTGCSPIRTIAAQTAADLPAGLRHPARRPRGEPAPRRRPHRPVRPHRRAWPARRRTTCRASSSSTGRAPTRR